MSHEMEVMNMSEVINCVAGPRLNFCGLKGLRVHRHNNVGGSQFRFDPMRIKLVNYLDVPNRHGSSGLDFAKALKDQPVLNANVLDWLLKHPEAIPEGWRGKVVHFMGSVLKDAEDDDNVRGYSRCLRVRFNGEIEEDYCRFYLYPDLPDPHRGLYGWWYEDGNVNPPWGGPIDYDRDGEPCYSEYEDCFPMLVDVPIRLPYECMP